MTYHDLRKTTSLLLALGLALSCTLSAAAQGTSDGSIYSRFGLGELRSFASSQAQAMGGGGTSMLSFNYVNFDNPGSWSDQVLTRLSAGLLYESLQARDAADNTSRLTQGSLNAIQFSFPILTRQLGAAFSFQPYSRVSYQVRSDGQLAQDPVLGDTVGYQIRYQGSGGLQQVNAGVGYRLNRNLSVGASLNFLFGILEDVRITSFSGVGFQPSNVINATRLSGFTGTLGVLGTLPSLLGEQDLLTFGASLTLPASLGGERIRTLGRTLDESLNRDTLGAPIEGDVQIPLSMRMGLSYRPDARWTFVLDGQYEPWSQFESDFAFAGYNPRLTDDAGSFFNDRVRASGGVEFLPAGSDLLASFLGRVAYRLGAYYEQAYVSPVADVNLRTFAVTGGLGLPTLFPGTRLDVNMEVGTRGTVDQNLVQDVFYRVSGVINFGERWFEQRKLR